ncbi:DUF2996 domain-containing protein [Synechococcus sp. PCC 6312]|uniref:DUF2996 domain-containing protein n=1 Tax=Synechococcus sp. (strain ATCC 27167 / PCC 6312) TaxID=195253 RepID=UPI00029ED4B9|nr:DUF2996 domain-containing protein [Synechococcus sp. PCC 6312]AFY60269.1 Protein of unknown function (DUF2996) [Synechococcus sp. PCC 6312]
MSEESVTPGTTEATPTTPVKKEKPPAVEAKPFAEFIQQDFLPALTHALQAKQVQNVSLAFTDGQIQGQWQPGQHQFNLYFLDEDIQGRKAFSETMGGVPSSTIEPFLCDERKVTLDLLVFGIVQRLNAQKWLGGN